MIVFVSVTSFSQTFTLPTYAIRGDKIKSILSKYALIEIKFSVGTTPTVTIQGYTDPDGTTTPDPIADFNILANHPWNNHSGKPNVANKVQCYGNLGLSNTQDWDWLPVDASTYYLVPQLVYIKKYDRFFVHFRIKELPDATTYYKSMNPIPPATPAIYLQKKKKVH